MYIISMQSYFTQICYLYDSIHQCTYSLVFAYFKPLIYILQPILYDNIQGKYFFTIIPIFCLLLRSSDIREFFVNLWSFFINIKCICQKKVTSEFIVQKSIQNKEINSFGKFYFKKEIILLQMQFIPNCNLINQTQMNYPLPIISGPQASVIQTILDATAEVSLFLRHSPIIVLESTNKFGDTQLKQDVHTDQIIQKHLKLNPLIKGFASEQRPELEEFNGQGQGYYVTFDPLDGSSIVVNNFTVGSIFAIWPRTVKKLIGEKIGSQANGIISLYGPRTTALFYNGPIDKVQQITLVDDKWVLSHQHLVIKPKTNIFSPGNLRASQDSETYKNIIIKWLDRGYTLRYSGGFAPDAAQIMLKGHGIFSCIASKKHKAKLRVLYQVAPIAFLIQKAGGKTITDKGVSLMEIQNRGYDDRITFAMGSSDQIDMMAHAFKQQ